jgi:hypothetical protein
VASRPKATVAGAVRSARTVTAVGAVPRAARARATTESSGSGSALGVAGGAASARASAQATIWRS